MASPRINAQAHLERAHDLITAMDAVEAAFGTFGGDNTIDYEHTAFLLQLAHEHTALAHAVIARDAGRIA